MESAGGEKEAPSSASPSSSSGSLLPAEKSTKPQPLEHGKEEPGAASVAMGQAQGPPSAAPLSVAPKTATPTPAPNLHPTHNNAAASPAGSANDGDWGWDAMGSEDGDDGSDAGGHPLSPGPSPTSPPPSNAMNKPPRGSANAMRSSSSLQAAGSLKINGGITSSPSFQELERAIGEAMNLTTSASVQSLDSDSGDPSRPSRSGSSSNLSRMHSGTDLTLQKMQQQSQQAKRNRMPLQQSQPNPRYSPSQLLQPRSPNHHSPPPHQQYSNPYHHHHHQQPFPYFHHHPHQQHPQQLYVQPQLQQSQTVPIKDAAPPVDARTELAGHTNESESRALILFHSPDLSPVRVRDACQKFGVLYYIRPEFHCKGVTLLSYFDLRLAIRAQTMLSEELGDETASAHFSIMLHATNSNTEEFRLVVQNLPEGRGEMTEVESIFARYGQLRSIQRIFGDGDIDRQAGAATSAFSIEYFNIQDARLAASELGATTTQLWGPDIVVGFAPLDTRKQLLCRQLLSTLSRWRTELSPFPAMPMSMQHNQQMSMPLMYQQEPFGYMPGPHNGQGQMMIPGYHGGHNSIIAVTLPMQVPNYHNRPPPLSNYPPPQHLSPMHQQQQHARGPLPHVYSSQPTMTPGKLGPDGGADVATSSSVIGEENSGSSSSSSSSSSGNNGSSGSGGERDGEVGDGAAAVKPPAVSTVIPPLSSLSQPQYYADTKGPPVGAARGAFPAPTGPLAYEQRPQHHNGGHSRRAKGAPEEADFTLSIDKLKITEDPRTTVMIRNIPNKYNQQMLLEEVNANHEGTYDFFYLPIDFKNRCNVGYAFVNFTDPRHMVSFVGEFHGQRWKSFNSGKVCAVTYARIQGQSAMVSRFQNSSLLEKEDEYKPLLFYSSGPLRGQREPFPAHK